MNDAPPAAPAPGKSGLRRVVAASAAGTALEWYDFFLFIPLAGILSKAFFSGLTVSAGYIFALGAFAVGFAFRPLGALLFGRLGDRAGRKSTFLITMILMGGATFAIGLLPTYQSIGIAAPIAFLLLRILQGMALGGEWGGAAIYIAEHAPEGRRGVMGSWLGSSAALGLLAALLIVLATRTILGEDAFVAWGWRLPFLTSAALLVLSIWIRLKLSESPVFHRMKAEGRLSEHPYTEAFLTWPNLRRVLLVLFAVMVGQGAVWYTGFFYASFFMETVVGIASATVNLLMIGMVIASAPLYVFFGALSDRIGRKPVMLSGMILFLVILFPGFHAMTQLGNPPLAQATTSAQVTVVADAAECGVLFDPMGTATLRRSCDLARSALAASGIPYEMRRGGAATDTHILIGARAIPVADGTGLDAGELGSLRRQIAEQVQSALQASGFPSRADPEQTSVIGLFLILMLFCISATALYGPQAAALVELFPARIRYTAVSLPYHVGTGWVGGFLPASAFAMVAASGDIYFGLWYPAIATAISVGVMLFWLPETRGRSFDL